MTSSVAQASVHLGRSIKMSVAEEKIYSSILGAY
jgi:hypothetical protein